MSDETEQAMLAAIRDHIADDTGKDTYGVEDISGADVSAYRYQISYLPEAIIPIELKDGSQ